MNISNLILQLELVAKNTSSSYNLMLIAKTVERLKAGAVSVVSTISEMPTVSNSKIGEIYLVENDNDLYVNNGTSWASLNNEALETLLVTGVNTSYGLFGNNSNASASASSPIVAASGITGWTQIAVSDFHAIAINSSGIAYGWGYNTNGGAVGDGTTTHRYSPVTVVGGITNWKQVSAGERYSLGVTTSGVAYAWGRNLYGNLGTNSTTSSASPVTVVGGITNWKQVSAGRAHSLGVTTSGVAYAWGRNNLGQLGDGTITNKSSPISIVGGITNWSQVSASFSSNAAHSLGVTSTGVAYAWGHNSYGQLGNNSTVSTSSPVSIVGGITNWKQVSAGHRVSLGVTTSGIAYGWGSGASGELGDGTTTNRSSPVTVVGGITNWKQISNGSGGFTLGVTSSGIAYAWGTNVSGTLGDGTVTNRSSPVTVQGSMSSWNYVAASGYRTGFFIGSKVKTL